MIGKTWLTSILCSFTVKASQIGICFTVTQSRCKSERVCPDCQILPVVDWSVSPSDDLPMLTFFLCVHGLFSSGVCSLEITWIQKETVSMTKSQIWISSGQLWKGELDNRNGGLGDWSLVQWNWLSDVTWVTVKLQMSVRYPFSYFCLETGSYELIFVLSRASKQNYIEIRWPQDKNKFSSDIKFRTFFKSTKVRN